MRIAAHRPRGVDRWRGPAVALAAGALACAPALRAQPTTSWANSAGGDFHDAANWSAGAPGPGVSAVFTAPGLYDVLFGGIGASIDSVSVGAGANVVFDLNGALLQLDSAGVRGMRIGSDAGDEASLRIRNGVVIGGPALIGATVGGRGALTLDGPNTSVSLTSRFLLGLGGAASMRIAGGAQLDTGNAFVGGTSRTGVGAHRSRAEIVVEGANSRWIVNSQLWLGGFFDEIGQGGDGGSANMLVLDGAEVIVGSASVGPTRSSDASLTISGAGTRWEGTLFVGARRHVQPFTVTATAGSGRVMIADGALAEAVCVNIGGQLGATGEIVVTGPGSRLIAGVAPGGFSCETDLGVAAHGALSVLNGGRADASIIAVIGSTPGFGAGSIFVDGFQSTFTTPEFVVGSNANINVRNGGLLQVGLVRQSIGVFGTSFRNALLSVSGGGSELTVGAIDGVPTGTGELRLGMLTGERASLEISDQAIVRARTMTLGRDGIVHTRLFSSGFSPFGLDPPGGKIIVEGPPGAPNAGLLLIGGDTDFGSSRLTLAGLRDRVVANQIIIGRNGEVFGAGVLQAPLVINSGLIHPTREWSQGIVGRLAIEGGFSQTGSGELEMVPGNFGSFLDIQGGATLGGALFVRPDARVTALSDRNLLIQAASIAGRFSEVKIGPLPTGMVGEIEYTPTRVFFNVRALIADVDKDGFVGPADLLAVLAAWGSVGFNNPADVDRDGVVGPGDLLLVLGDFGSGAKPPPIVLSPATTG